MIKPLTRPALMPDAGLLVLRLGLATVVLFHGVFKFTHGIDWMKGPLGALGLPLAAGYGAYVAELLAPVLLIAGVWTRLAALLVVFDMVMAVTVALRGQLFAVKAGGGGWGIEIEALICFTALALVLAGGGKYSLMRD